MTFIRSGCARDWRAGMWIGVAALGLMVVVGCDGGAGDAAPGAGQKPTERPIVTDLDGHEVDPLTDIQAEAVVLIFVASDCPISNRYAPVMQDFELEYGPQGVTFYLVYPDPDNTAAIVRTHQSDYSLSMPALRDPWHVLVERSEVRVTPEVAVFVPEGHLVYHGRIDNRYVDYGDARPEATEHDLKDVLDTILAGEPALFVNREGTGCIIADLK